MRSLLLTCSSLAMLLLTTQFCALFAQDQGAEAKPQDTKAEGAAPQDAKSAAIERDRLALQGAWSLVSVEEGGKLRPESEFKDGRYVFLKDKILEMTGEKLNFEIDYEIDPSSNPKRINEYFKVKSKDGKPEELMIRGIYELEGDTLTLCTGAKERPTSFDSKQGVLLKLRREKKPPAKAEPEKDANPAPEKS